MTETPLYSSRIVQGFMRLVEKKYPRVDLKVVLHHAGIEPYQVSDAGHWFNQRQVNLFVKHLVQATGNPAIAREAGQFSASVESLGYMKKYLLGVIGPANAFNSIKIICSNLTKSSSYHSRKLSSNKVEITVTPAEGVEEALFQCENRLGSFEAMLGMLGCNSPAIEHPECLFRGDATCRYVISWKQSLYLRVRGVTNYLSLFLVAGCSLVAPFHPFQALTAWVPAVAIVLLAGSCLAGQLEKAELHAALSSLKESTDELLDQTALNYNNALIVNEVGQAISKQAGIDEVLENVVKALENRLSYDRGLILLADPEQQSLGFRTGFGYSEQQQAALRDAAFNLTNPESKGVFVTCFRDQKPVLISNFSEVSELHSARSQIFAERIEAQSFICCAIVCEGESLGVLAVDNVWTGRALVQSDLSLLMGIAPMVGISIRNAMYIERERQRAEQMRESQKMEAVGQLAGGIAHDFNNLLTAIIGFASLAQLSLDQDNPAARYLNEVMVSSERAAHLTQGLLSFSRKQSNNPQPIELNGAVERIEKLLRRLISEEFELALVYGHYPLPVVADPGQVDQVIINLATNARDAMDHSGVLTIETSLVQVTAEGAADCGRRRPGSYARIAIGDTGKGMDEATRAHIFEPFFTTKEVGKGTGLGLAIVYGIVEQHCGFIVIDSTPGQGTTFNIHFPLLERQAMPVRPVLAAAAPRAGAETVLVVEDAPEVRLLTRKVLESRGYRVIEAVDGEDCLEKFREHQNEVQLVIMDVVMPRMNGKEAFAEISRIRPGTKVLFTSGYTPDDVNKKGVLFGKDNFIGKPCSPEALLGIVGDLLA